MRRNATQQEDSLDLLLDAISNTFGGVLFLAVLVVILLQFTGDPETVTQTTEAEQAERREVIRLEQDLKNQRAVIKAQLGNTPEELVREVLGLRKELLKFVKDRPVEDGDARTKDFQLAFKLHEAKAEKTRIEGQIEEIDEVQSRSAKLPRLRETKKKEFPMVMSSDRLCLLFDAARGSQRGAPRLDRFEAVPAPGPDQTGLVTIPQDDGSSLVVKPRAGTGIDLTNEAGIVGALRQELVNLNPDQTYLAIAVFEDSFGSFGALRNALVELGFEYRLIPMEPGNVVGSSGSGSVRVQ